MTRFRAIRQHDSTECGATCIRMVASHYGKRYTSETLQRICVPGPEGISLMVMRDAAYNRPVFLMGYATAGGHAWVCDAWKRHHYDNNEYYDYLNMNWGWGGSSNGFYYIDSPMSFNTGCYTFYYGFEMITNIRP